METVPHLEEGVLGTMVGTRWLVDEEGCALELLHDSDYQRRVCQEVTVRIVSRGPAAGARTSPRALSVDRRSES